jgi:hypothetical protein
MNNSKNIGYVSCPTSAGYELEELESVSIRGLKQQATKMFHITEGTKLYLYNDSKEVIAHKEGFNSWVDCN